MNLYLRLLLLLLKLPFMAREEDMLSPTKLTMHVWPNDLDFNLHMNNGRYLTIMDLGRFHLMVKKGVMWKIVKQKWQPVIGGIKMHFVRGLQPFERFELISQVIYWDEKWIYLEQTFCKDKTVMATALIKAAFTRQRKRITPQAVLSLMPHQPMIPPIPTHLQHWITAEENSKAARIGVA